MSRPPRAEQQRDRRSFAAWVGLGWGLMLVSYFLLPQPPAPAGDPNLPVNVNYVFGPSETESQTWLPAPAYLAAMMLVSGQPDGTTQNACGRRIPTAGMPASSGRSVHSAASVKNNATSQKYRKFVGPYVAR